MLIITVSTGPFWKDFSVSLSVNVLFEFYFRVSCVILSFRDNSQYKISSNSKAKKQNKGKNKQYFGFISGKWDEVEKHLSVQSVLCVTLILTDVFLVCFKYGIVIAICHCNGKCSNNISKTHTHSYIFCPHNNVWPSVMCEKQHVTV